MNIRQAQLPQGWVKKSLMDLANVSTGKWDANHAKENGAYRFYTCAYDYLLCDTKKFSGECLILPGNGVNVGEVFYYDSEFDAYQRTYVISDIKILPKYLHYHMLLHWKALGTKQQYGSATNFIKIGNFKEYEVEYPSLHEQQRIVSILDEAFAAIAKAKANAEQNRKNAKELFESYLEGVFEKKGDGWEDRQLKDIALVFGRGKSKHRPRNWEGLYGGDYPFIQTGEVRNANKYVTEYTQSYNEVGLKQSKLWKNGTICITIAANIAETAILDFDACFPDSIIGLQVDPKKADLDFTYYLLQFFKTELQKLGKGSAQDNINLGTFENKLFPFPKLLKEQQTIVHQLDALRAETHKLEAIYQQKLINLEELKKSVLQKAFAGEF